MKNITSVHKGFRFFLGAVSVSIALAAVPAAATDYALLVGVGSYDANYLPNVQLTGPAADIRNMRSLLLASEVNTWGEDTVMTLADAQAAKGDPAILPLDADGNPDSSIAGLGIRSWIAYFASFLESGDTFLYYHSGHGGNYTPAGSYGKATYLSAYDASYSDAELAKDLAAFKPGVRILVIADASFAGGLAPLQSSPVPSLPAAVNAYMETTAPDHAQVGWISSTSYDTESADGATGSAFTQLFINGAQVATGDAAPYGNGDGLVDAAEAFRYAASRSETSPQIANAAVCAQFVLAGSSRGLFRVELRGNPAPTKISPETYTCYVLSTNGEESAIYQQYLADCDLFDNGELEEEPEEPEFDNLPETQLPATAVDLWGIDPSSAGTFNSGVLTLSSAAPGTDITLSASGLYKGVSWSAELVVTVGDTSLAFAEALDTVVVSFSPEKWTSSNGAQWFGQSGVSFDGEDAVQSLPTSASGDTRALTGTFNGSGTFSFWYSVSAPAEDGLVVTIDGGEILRAVGNVDWTQAMAFVGPGDHTVVFTYTRSSAASEADVGRAWVDHIVLLPVTHSFDMNANDNGWTTGGYLNQWERGVPVFGPTDGGTCWGTDLDGRYADSVDCWLMSPSMFVAADAVLTFRTWFDIDNTAWSLYAENGSEYASGWKTYLDGGFVEVSVNGTGWQNITADLSCPGFASGKTIGGTSGGWVTASVPLPAEAAGKSVRVRFRFASDAYVDTDAGGSPAGWFIDDVALCVAAPTDLLLVRTDISDSASGNNNGIVEPGESIWVAFELANQGEDPVTGLSGTIQCNVPGVTLPSTSTTITYGDIDAGGRASASPRLLVSVADTVAPGTVVRLAQTITDADGNHYSFESAFTVANAVALQGTVYEVRATDTGTENVPIAGASVFLGNGLKTTSSASGQYSFPAIAAGTYTATASADGFAAPAPRAITVPGANGDFYLGKAYAVLSQDDFTFAIPGTDSASNRSGSFSIANTSRADGTPGTVSTAYSILFPEGRPAWLALTDLTGSILPGASRTVSFAINAAAILADPRLETVVRISSNDCEGGYEVQDITVRIALEGLSNAAEYLVIESFEGSNFPYHEGDSDGYLERGESGSLSFTVANGSLSALSDLVVTSVQVVEAPTAGTDVSDITVLSDLADIRPTVRTIPADGSGTVVPAIEISIADAGVPDPVYTLEVTLASPFGGDEITLRGDYAVYDRHTAIGTVYAVDGLGLVAAEPEEPEEPVQPAVTTNVVLTVTTTTPSQGYIYFADPDDLEDVSDTPDELYSVPVAEEGAELLVTTEERTIPLADYVEGDYPQTHYTYTETHIVQISVDAFDRFEEVPVVPVTNAVLTVTTTTPSQGHICFANPDDPSDISDTRSDTYTVPVPDPDEGAELIVTTEEITIPLDEYDESDYPDTRYITSDEEHGIVVQITVTEFARFEEEREEPEPGPQPEPAVRVPVAEAIVYGVGPEGLVETVTQEDGTYVLHGLRNGYNKVYATRSTTSVLTGMSMPVLVTDLAEDLPNDAYYAAVEADPVGILGIDPYPFAVAEGIDTSDIRAVCPGLDLYIGVAENAALEVAGVTVQDENGNGVLEPGETFSLTLTVANNGIGICHGFSVGIVNNPDVDGGTRSLFTDEPLEGDTLAQLEDEEGNPVFDDDGNPVYRDLQLIPGNVIADDALDFEAVAGDAGMMSLLVKLVDYRQDVRTREWVPQSAWYSTLDLEVVDSIRLSGQVTLDGDSLPATLSDGSDLSSVRIFLEKLDPADPDTVLSTSIVATDDTGAYAVSILGDLEGTYRLRPEAVVGAIAPVAIQFEATSVPADLDFDYTSIAGISVTPSPLEVTHGEGESTTATVTFDNGSPYDLVIDSVLVRYTRTATDMAIASARRAAAAAEPDGDTGDEFFDADRDVPGELYVTFAAGVPVADQDALLASLGLAPSPRHRLIPAVHCSFDAASASYESLRAALLASGLVAKVETVRILRTGVEAIADYVDLTDSLADGQWAVLNERQTGGTLGADVNVVPLWQRGVTGSRKVVVAVHDSGVAWDHPDLIPNLYVNEAELGGLPGVDDDGNGYVDDIHGWNFADDTPDSTDANGHGTHVAGIIGAAANGYGTVGVNWDVTLLPIRVADAEGKITVTDENLIRSFEYMLDCGVQVCNCSWGSSYLGQSPKAAQGFKAAADAGILFVFSAGNDAVNNDTHIGSSGIQAGNMITVAACDHDGRIASFSNWGAQSVDLAAPGVDVLSCFPADRIAGFDGEVADEDHVYLDGTSMAAPYVTGAAALLLSSAPDTPTSLIRAAILAGVRRDDSLSGWVSSSGYLDIAGAFAALGADWLVCTTEAPVSIAAGSSADFAFDVNPDLTLIAGEYAASIEFRYAVDGQPQTLVVPVTDTVSVAASVSVDSVVVDDSASGDGDGYAEPGETVSLAITLRNDSAAKLSGATGTIGSASASFPDLVPGSTGSNADSVVVTIPASASGTAVFDMALEGVIGTDEFAATVPVEVPVRQAASVAGTVCDSANRGIAGAIVEFWTSGTPDDPDGTAGYVAAGRVVADSAGAYRVDGLAVGATAYLRAIPAGYARFLSIARAENLTAGTAAVNFTVNQGSIAFNGLENGVLEKTVLLNDDSATASFTIMNPGASSYFLKSAFIARKSVLLVSDGEALNPLAPVLQALGFGVDVLDHNYTFANASYGAYVNGNVESIAYTADAARFLSYDFVVLSLDGDSGTGRKLTAREASAIQSYLDRGGRVLLTGGNLLSRPDDAVLATLLGNASLDRLDATAATAYPVAVDPFSLPSWSFPGLTDPSFSGLASYLGISNGEPVALPGEPFAYDVATPALPFTSYATVAQGAAQKLYRFDSGNGALFFWGGNANASDIAQRGVWQDIFRDIIFSELFETISWASLDSTAFAVPATRSTTRTVTFDTADLDAGDYQASLVLYGEFSDAETVAVPVTLHVTRPLFTAYSNTGVTNAFGAYLKGDGNPGSYVYQLILTPTGSVSAPDANGLPSGGETVVATASSGLYYGYFGSDGVTTDLGQFSERYEIPYSSAPVYAVVRAWTGTAPGAGAFWGDSAPYAVQFTEGETYNFGTWAVGNLFQVDGTLPLDSNGDGVPDVYVLEHFPGLDPSANLTIDPSAEFLQEVKNGSSSYAPYRVFATDRYVYALDNNQKRITVWTTEGRYGTFVGFFRPSGSVQFTNPVGMGLQPGANRFAVSDAERHVAHVFEFNEDAIAAATSQNLADAFTYVLSVGTIDTPYGQTDANGNAGVFTSPKGVAMDAEGAIYVVDSGRLNGESGRRVLVFNADGSARSEILPVGADLVSPEGIDVDPATGDIYIANTGAGNIVRLSSAGAALGVYSGVTMETYDSRPLIETRINPVTGRSYVVTNGTVVVTNSVVGPVGPTDVKVWRVGSTYRLLVADRDGNAIHILDSTGNFVATFTNPVGNADTYNRVGNFRMPWGVFPVAETAEAWVADTRNNRLQHLNLTLDGDGDGIDDTLEMLNGLDPTTPDATDTDGDGITDAMELALSFLDNRSGSATFGTNTHTDIDNVDSDGDGLTDFEEVNGGTNPLDPEDAANTTVTVSVTAQPAEGGSVTGGGTYSAGSTATLVATPVEGWQFAGWQDGETAATRDVKVGLYGNNYVALFERQAFAVTVTFVDTNLVVSAGVPAAQTYDAYYGIAFYKDCSDAFTDNYVFVSGSDSVSDKVYVQPIIDFENVSAAIEVTFVGVVGEVPPEPIPDVPAITATAIAVENGKLSASFSTDATAIGQLWTFIDETTGAATLIVADTLDHLAAYRDSGATDGIDTIAVTAVVDEATLGFSIADVDVSAYDALFIIGFEAP